MATIHGNSTKNYTSPEYKTWEAMNQRCNNKNSDTYPKYGGSGITICKRWKSFTNFLADMGKKPTPRHTIERIDGTKGYFPKNCRWATYSEQLRNRRNNVWITALGETHCLKDWSTKSGLPQDTIKGRLARGWTPDRAVSIPPLHPPSKYSEPMSITFNGETRNLNQWSKITGIKMDCLWRRIRKYRWPIERALTAPVESPIGKRKVTIPPA